MRCHRKSIGTSREQRKQIAWSGFRQLAIFAKKIGRFAHLADNVGCDKREGITAMLVYRKHLMICVI
jgi:hypothetical protein